MYSIYLARVISCHCCTFTEHYNFIIFWIKWDRNIIITFICDHFSHAKCRWLVIFSFTNLKCCPNVHVTAATAHHVSRAIALALEIFLSCLSSSLDNAIILLYNSFSPSGEQPEHCILAYKSKHQNNQLRFYIAIFHKYCCYIKHGSILTNLTLHNSWWYVTDMSKYHNVGIRSTD